MSEVLQLDRYPQSFRIRAKFMPKRVDTLRAEFSRFSGQSFEFSYVGRGDPDEPYPGQWRWICVEPREFWAWVPQEDLEDIEWLSA
jgi:hypothetical protein